LLSIDSVVLVATLRWLEGRQGVGLVYLGVEIGDWETGNQQFLEISSGVLLSRLFYPDAAWAIGGLPLGHFINHVFKVEITA